MRVRRWGFPRSGLHPVFTPSRLHMDLSYTFYPGMPYFLKEGRMDAVTAFETPVIRDDEWLFWGLPFSDGLWLDRNGLLHEGEPGEGEDEQRGVGFFNRDSRDAFIALWLEHRAENHGSLDHSGGPNLSYYGRGQIWCRAPIMGTTQLEKGAALIQRNAYLAMHYPEENGRELVMKQRQRLLHPLKAAAGELPENIAASSSGSLARPGETGSVALDGGETTLKRAVWKALREVRDDQLMQVDGNVVDLGYIYDVRVSDGAVHIVMTMPHRGRPKYQFIANPIRARVLEIPEVRQCVVECTWEPEWTAARLSVAGRQVLGL